MRSVIRLSMLLMLLSTPIAGCGGCNAGDSDVMGQPMDLDEAEEEFKDLD